MSDSWPENVCLHMPSLMSHSWKLEAIHEINSCQSKICKMKASRWRTFKIVHIENQALVRRALLHPI